MAIATLVLSKTLRAAIEKDAKAAGTRECCGLIEGRREFDVVIASAVHATRNLASEDARFEIDPVEHIRLLRAARANGDEIVGCYHSHPGGAPQPSEQDKACADEEDFLWIIAAVRDGAVELRAFAWADGDFHAVVLAEKKPA